MCLIIPHFASDHGGLKFSKSLNRNASETSYTAG